MRIQEVNTFGSSDQDLNLQWTPHQKRLHLLANANHMYGHLLGGMEKKDQQIFHYKQTIDISETIRESFTIALATMNLGKIYSNELGKLDSALIMEQKAEQMLFSFGR